VLAIASIAVANLRGVRESGRLFALPTYLFIASMLGLIAYGALGALFGFLPEAPYVPHAPGLQGVGLFLLLRAFRVGLRGAHRRRGGLERHPGLQAPRGAQRPRRDELAGRAPRGHVPRHQLPRLRLRHRAARDGKRSSPSSPVTSSAPGRSTSRSRP
jgi:hypothetical protein